MQKAAIAAGLAASQLLVGANGNAAPAAMATCTRVTAVITAGAEPYESVEQVPCVVTKGGSVNFDAGVPGKGDPSSRRGTWTGNLPANETGSAYLTDADLAGDLRAVLRPSKPLIDGAAYFGSIFAEPLIQYQQAAINRNQSVDTNLGSIRGSANATSNDLAQALASRSSGLTSVTGQLRDRLAANLQNNVSIGNAAQQTVVSVKSKLDALPKQQEVIDVAALDRAKSLPAAIVQSVGSEVDHRRLVGNVGLLGGAKVNTNGLVNAVDAEMARFEKLDSTLRAKPEFLDGIDALRQARYYAVRSPAMASALYAEALNARAFLVGEAKVREVAVWNSAEARYELQDIASAFNRVLPLARFFGDRTSDARSKINEAAQGAKFKPDDTTLRVTEQLLDDAEERLGSDPVASLGGLFRARTLLENAKLYGGAWVKLNKWAKGASGRLREAFAPPKTQLDPGEFGKDVATGISKGLREAMSNYKSAVEAGDYALLGSDKVNDIFGAEMLTDLKSSLKGAVEAARREAGPLANLDEVAPPVALWVSNDARIANFENTKEEIAELSKLRDLYTARVQTLQLYSTRLGALDKLSSLYSSELSQPGWGVAASMKCLSTICAAEIIAMSEQLSEISSLSRDAAKEVGTTTDRYKAEIEKLEKLIDAWIQVRPNPANPGATIFRRPLRDMSEQLR